jgi:hypothetical protein
MTNLQLLGRLVGRWTTEATHPAMPGVVVRGTASIEWLEGEQFLIQRARNDHPDFPDSVAIIGCTEHDRVNAASRPEPSSPDQRPLTMHYFDSRGVFRVYDTSIDSKALRFLRFAPGFSQRFTGSFDDDGNVIAGLWQLSEDEADWKDDLKITYRRQA